MTICDCPVFYNVGKVSYNWTNVRAIEVKTERIKDLRLYVRVMLMCNKFYLLIRKTIYINGSPIDKIGEAIAIMIGTAAHFTLNE